MSPARVEASAQPAPPGMHVPHSRWRSSQVSFGPVGRLVLSLLLLLPLLWFWQVGMFGWTGLIIWGGTFLPWALRDVWRKARVRTD